MVYKCTFTCMHVYTLKYNNIVHTCTQLHIHMYAHHTHTIQYTQGKAHTYKQYTIARVPHTWRGKGVHTHTLRSQVCGNRSGFRGAQCQGNLSTHTQGPHNAKPIGPDQRPIRSDDVNQVACTYVRTYDTHR